MDHPKVVEVGGNCKPPLSLPSPKGFGPRHMKRLGCVEGCNAIHLRKRGFQRAQFPDFDKNAGRSDYAALPSLRKLDNRGELCRKCRLTNQLGKAKFSLL